MRTLCEQSFYLFLHSFTCAFIYLTLYDSIYIITNITTYLKMQVALKLCGYFLTDFITNRHSFPFCFVYMTNVDASILLGVLPSVLKFPPYLCLPLSLSLSVCRSVSLITYVHATFHVILQANSFFQPCLSHNRKDESGRFTNSLT